MVNRFSSPPFDAYAVSFQGEVIHCNCMADVLALKSANVILETHTESRYAPRDIEGLTVVLRRYGRAQAVASLRQSNSRARAVQFLFDSIGYVRPCAIKRAQRG